ncbi:cysteine hydrolase family protein [Caldalkalibacillus salinus]|uniref:cysteine hydrolase family protein n=1 Tax=Caldalkalibacillus salinus TaxID=2803787 RepID=UPI001922BD4F|nr:isochorismatase family cysteine hydrolase [Caldalkalibacillus salinus]
MVNQTVTKALINIDYTYDFVAEDGRLTCGEPGQAIEEKICELTQAFIDEGAFVAFAIDLHHEDDRYHPETALFPPHNVAGTKGRQLYGRLEDVYLTHQAKPNVYYTDKTRYSAFAGTDLDLQLRARGIQELHLVGVCTDICVLHTAVDAYNLGYKLVIHQQAVASFNTQGHEWALGHFKNCLGADVR